MRLKRRGILAWIAGLAVTGGAVAAQKPATTSNTAAATRALSLEGDWSGTLQIGETELQLVLHLSRDAQGSWHAKLDSLNQAVYGMDASKVAREEDTLRVEIASVGAKFAGKIEPDGRAIRGIWEQGGTGLPLKFEKRSAGAFRGAALNAVSNVEGTWQGAIEVT